MIDINGLNKSLKATKLENIKNSIGLKNKNITKYYRDAISYLKDL